MGLQERSESEGDRTEPFVDSCVGTGPLFPIASKTVQVSSPAVWNSETRFFLFSFLFLVGHRRQELRLQHPRRAKRPARGGERQESFSETERTRIRNRLTTCNRGWKLMQDSKQASKQMKEIGRAVYFAANHI